LLPRWRGAAPIQRAILAGDTMTGVTIMLMDVGLDTGPMLLRKEVRIEAGETGGSLHDRLAMLGGSTLIEALDGHASGTLRAIPQSAAGVTYAAKIEKAEALIDWKRDAVEIERQVRAFNPWPVAETRLDGEQLRVFEARAEEGDGPPLLAGTRAPGEFGDGNFSPVTHTFTDNTGTIIAVRDDSLVVQCGRGLLALHQLQRPGRRVVPAADFARSLELTGRRLG
jgi:methionyl-tRNA formyltransferase